MGKRPVNGPRIAEGHLLSLKRLDLRDAIALDPRGAWQRRTRQETAESGTLLRREASHRGRRDHGREPEGGACRGCPCGWGRCRSRRRQRRRSNGAGAMGQLPGHERAAGGGFGMTWTIDLHRGDRSEDRDRTGSMPSRKRWAIRPSLAIFAPRSLESPARRDRAGRTVRASSRTHHPTPTPRIDVDPRHGSEEGHGHPL
jgi:hypothetical protein